MDVYCSVSRVSIRLIISLILSPYVCGNLFKEVSSCPSDEVKWKERAQMKECKEPIPDFMCAAIENQPGRFGEICTVVGLTGKDECVVLDADTYNLNLVKCYATLGCPPSAYISSNLYKYPVCYHTNRETVSSTLTTRTEEDEQITTSNPENTVRDGSVHAIAISTFIVFLCVLLVFLMLLTKRISERKKTLENNVADEPSPLLNTDSKENTKDSTHQAKQDLESNVADEPSPLLNTGSKENIEESTHQAKRDSELEARSTNKISTLGAYMKLQLLNYSKVKNFRFYMVTHSESFKLHFKENFDRMINSSAVDWTKFDLDTVYTLLTNCCGITCPDRGWGYKPTDEDISVGADIERIRILVNEYLDYKIYNIEEADQILKRWRWIKKEIDPFINFEHEKKINYKKLKPNNVVEHGTVVTRAIANILEKLKSKKIVTCCGAIGCGKTAALKYVTKKYSDDGWTTEWMEEFMDESFFNSVIERDSDKIIICCDNLFGSFGCQVFSEKMFDKFHYYMGSIFRRDNNIKLLLGIHEHVNEEMSSKCSLVSQNYNVFVKMDSLSQSEALLICMMQQEKSNIKQESIPFDDVIKVVDNNNDVVGTPFLTLMISEAPRDFGKKEFWNQPFQKLTEHFIELYSCSKEMFYSLLYISCVIFDKREDEVKKDIASAIYSSLNKNIVVMNLPYLAPYVQNDGDSVEIKHDVIAIALFHAFMMKSEKPWKILQACDIRAVLELIRPCNQHEKLHPFAFLLSGKTLCKEKKALKSKIVQNKVDITGHPLSKHFA